MQAASSRAHGSVFAATAALTRSVIRRTPSA